MITADPSITRTFILSADLLRKPMAIRYNVEFINPFLDAVIDVLSTMAGVTPTPGKPYINSKRTSMGDVTGLIGVTGYASGSVALTLSKGAILTIVNNMLSESYTEINPDIADAVGELTNMITGQARRHLSEQGMSFQSSTPSVVIGPGHQVSHVNKAPILSIPFTTDSGSLVVEVCFSDATV